MSGCVVVFFACQTGPTPTLRPLPTTLSTDANRLLEGCQMRDGAFEMELACPDDIVVAQQAQPMGLEATFIGVAVEQALVRGARVAWTDASLVTDGGPVPLRHAAYLAPDGSDVGFLTGVSRPDGQLRDDLWCSSASTAQLGRCEAILTALLQPQESAPASSTAMTPGPTGTPHEATTTSTEPGTPPTGGTAQLRGRALSLPTTCRIDRQDQTRGVYVCEGHSLAWKVIDDMDQATEEADALFGALPADEDPRPLPCRLGHEAAVCRGTPLVVVGTAFVDGVALFAQCVARDAAVDVMESGPCRALMNGSW
jgi:hypothetical protein